MQKYKKVYLDYYGLTVADWIPCKSCGTTAIDIHHIEPKGMGGSKTKDVIENLVALCRECHNKAHDSKEFNENLKNND